jgi:hypothetical protein
MGMWFSAMSQLRLGKQDIQVLVGVQFSREALVLFGIMENADASSGGPPPIWPIPSRTRLLAAPR